MWNVDVAGWNFFETLQKNQIWHLLSTSIQKKCCFCISLTTPRAKITSCLRTKFRDPHTTSRLTSSCRYEFCIHQMSFFEYIYRVPLMVQAFLNCRMSHSYIGLMLHNFDEYFYSMPWGRKVRNKFTNILLPSRQFWRQISIKILTLKKR